MARLAPVDTGLYSDEPHELSSAQVLRRDIPWDIYKSARFISDRELQLIKRYDKKDASYQGKLLAEVGDRGSGASGPCNPASICAEGAPHARGRRLGPLPSCPPQRRRVACAAGGRGVRGGF